MNKKQKDFIEKATIIQNEKELLDKKFYVLHIINSDKNYNGFWGKNGFRDIIVIGETEEQEYYNLTQNEEVDVVWLLDDEFSKTSLHFDISSKTDAFRLWIDSSYFEVKYFGSTLRFSIKKRTDE